MERRWRFVYDDTSTGRWGWQVHENLRVKIASLCAFATLDGCINHARESGFTFTQNYDIVFLRGGAESRDAAD